MKQKDLMIEAAMKMDALSKHYCCNTKCTDKRMKSVYNVNNCQWYHGGWMYCRLAGIVVTEDYLGSDFESFFFMNGSNNDEINILACGIADYGLLVHIFDRIPNNLKTKIHIFAIDICKTPLELCKWFFSREENSEYNQIDVTYIQADATKLPFESDFFDLITSYSFLTRMTKDLSSAVLNEWHRVLKQNGEILTTIHINSDDSLTAGDFYRSNNENLDFAMQKVSAFLNDNEHLGESFSKRMKDMVKGYLINIMSVAIPGNDAVKRMFNKYTYCYIRNVNQPGELEAIHKMTIVRAIK